MWESLLGILNLDAKQLARRRSFENGHNGYFESRRGLYAVDVANQRVRKFLKIRN